jgi:predicted DNA-binding transcriptional regulator AlpA
MRRQLLATIAAPPPIDPPLDPRRAAVVAGLSLPAFWRAVAAGRLPMPIYPASRAPRWYASEIRAALESTRALPCEAKDARRRARLNVAA